MHFDQQHNNSPFCLRQEKSDHSTHQRRSRHRSPIPKDVAAENYVRENGFLLAIERDGFWRGCWAGYVASDPQGRRVLLDNSKQRRAMRRLLEAGAFASRIDLGEQHKREAFDRKMRLAERLAERCDRRDWERTR
jgi:hypothetical protein